MNLQPGDDLERIEGLVRFSNYPNIIVYPIAVYQRLGSLVPIDEGTEITDSPEG